MSFTALTKMQLQFNSTSDDRENFKSITFVVFLFWVFKKDKQHCVRK